MRRVFLVASYPGLRSALALTIQEQGNSALSVAGATGWDPGELTAVAAAQPDAIVLAIGLETGSELRVLEQVRRLAPGSRIVVVDTLGEAGAWQMGTPTGADALLPAEQLAAELVPTLLRLTARRGPELEQSCGAGAPPAA